MAITQQAIKAILDFLKWLIQSIWKNLWKSLALLIVGGFVFTGYQCEIGPFKVTKKELSKPSIRVGADSPTPGIEPISPPSARSPGKLPVAP